MYPATQTICSEKHGKPTKSHNFRNAGIVWERKTKFQFNGDSYK